METYAILSTSFNLELVREWLVVVLATKNTSDW
jgi:hypothetical protein